MEIKVLEEAGYQLAKYGFSLSYKDRNIKPSDWMPIMCIGCYTDPEYCDNKGCRNFKDLKKTLNKCIRYDKVLKANAKLDNGHNKFLEHIMLWLDIEAPRYWWSEMDTYRVGVSKQSESTMHTLLKREVTLDDLECPSEEAWYEDMQRDQLDSLNEAIKHKESIDIVKSLVPESYKQRREVVLSYKVLRHIILQRRNHKLNGWPLFIESVLKQVEHPELLPNKEW